MSLSIISNGTLSDASNINQVIYVLQRQAGQTEVGKYFLQGQGYTSLANFGNWIVSLSRGVALVSVSIDTADQSAAQGANTPGTAHLSNGGFLVFFTTGGTTPNGIAGGNYTLQY